MIHFDKVTYSYDDKKQASFSIKEASFTCSKEGVVGLIGPNGSGKTTIAKLILGLLRPKSGVITIDKRFDTYSGDLWKQVAFVIQNPDNQIFGSTVGEDIAMPLENLGVPRAEMTKRVSAAADAVGLYSRLEDPVHTLSGGEKQLLAIASAIVMKPSWIVFDEPTSFLDPWARENFWKAILKVQAEKGIGLLVISQLSEDFFYFDHLLAFDNGVLVFDGTPAGFRKNLDKMPWFTPPQSWIFEDLMAGGPK